MFSAAQPTKTKRPLIGCTTYRRSIGEAPSTAEMFGLTNSYVEAIVAAGGIPLLIPIGLGEDSLQTLLQQIDGLLLPGGGDIDPCEYGGQMHETVYGIDPVRDQEELFLARTAVASAKPILAICRGCQVLNVALGGSLWEDVNALMPNGMRHAFHADHPRNYLAHQVDVAPDSCLAAFVGSGFVGVNSLHHQGVRQLAPVLRAAAVAPDGLIEAIEAPAHPFAIGVQWHPESLITDDPGMLALFKGLIAAAGA